MACGIMNIYPHPGCTVSLPVPRAFLMWGVLVGEEIGPALSSNPHSTTMTGAASLSLTVVTNLNAQTVRRHTASPTNRPTTHTQMCLSHSSFLLMAHTCNGDSNIWACVYAHMCLELLWTAILHPYGFLLGPQISEVHGVFLNGNSTRHFCLNQTLNSQSPELVDASCLEVPSF